MRRILLELVRLQAEVCEKLRVLADVAADADGGSLEAFHWARLPVQAALRGRGGALDAVRGKHHSLAEQQAYERDRCAEVQLPADRFENGALCGNDRALCELLAREVAEISKILSSGKFSEKQSLFGSFKEKNF